MKLQLQLNVTTEVLVRNYKRIKQILGGQSLLVQALRNEIRSRKARI